MSLFNKAKKIVNPWMVAILVIGVLLFASAHIIWIGHALYAMFHGAGFWVTVFSNLGAYILQVVSGIVLFVIGFFKAFK